MKGVSEEGLRVSDELFREKRFVAWSDVDGIML